MWVFWFKEQLMFEAKSSFEALNMQLQVYKNRILGNYKPP